MTVSSTTTVYRYAGNGATTSFSFPARFNAQADLVVSLYDTTLLTTDPQVLTTDYTITGTVTNGKYLSGGNVVFGVAPPTGQTVIIQRSLALTQSSDYGVADPFEPDTLESDLDRLIMVDQQLDEELGRAVKLNIASALTDISLPVPVANATIAWNAGATDLTNGPSTAVLLAAEAAAVAAQAAAEAARDATLAAYDSFDDRYLGAKASDPVVDNDGGALAAGMLYYNTTVPEMRLYTGSAWVAAYVSGASFVVGAASSTDNAIARFDSTTGKIVQNSTVIVGDTGNVTGLGTLNTHTLPGGTDTVSLLAATQTLTNKTIVGANNTISGITEAMQTLADNTTNDCSTSKHGYLKKLSNVSTEFMNGVGNWATVSGLPTASTTATTSGTTVVFTVAFSTYFSYRFYFNGVSSNSSGNLTIEASDDGAGSYETTTYEIRAVTNTTWANVTDSIMTADAGSAVISGYIDVWQDSTGTTKFYSNLSNNPEDRVAFGGGSMATAAACNRIRFAGIGTFDLGSISVIATALR